MVAEMIPGMTLETLQSMTEPKLQLAPGYKDMMPPARAA